MAPNYTPFRGTSLSSLAYTNPVRAVDLHITNEDLAPDGFNRTVVVAGGTLPGTLIKGNKVVPCRVDASGIGVDFVLFRETGFRSMFMMTSLTKHSSSRPLS